MEPIQLESSRKLLLCRLKQAVAEICKRYEGRMASRINLYLEADKIFAAYFLMTQRSQDVANETKRNLFLDFSKNIGIAKPKIARHACETGTVRTPKWVQLLGELIPWWTDDEVSGTIDKRKDLVRALSGRIEGTIKSPWLTSSPAEMGTFIHEAYGEVLANHCARMFSWRNLQHVVPGRIIHKGLPFMGVTPDAISVADLDVFLRMLDDEDEISDEDRLQGMPKMSMELKTLHGQNTNVTAREISALVQDNDADQTSGKEKVKAKVLKLLQERLVAAKWMPSMERREKWKSSLFTRRSTKMVLVSDIENEVAISPEAIPNLCPLPLSLTTGEPQSKKRKTDYTIDLEKITKPGKACIIVFHLGEKEENRELFRLDWNEAPLILNINCDHFNQVLNQHMVLRQYNEDIKSVFAFTLSGKSMSKNQLSKPLALLYAYDTGIQRWTVNAASGVIFQELALASRYIKRSEVISKIFEDENIFLEGGK